MIQQRKSTLTANVPGAYYTLVPKKHGVNLSPPKPSDVHILIIISILQTRTLSRDGEVPCPRLSLVNGGTGI